MTYYAVLKVMPNAPVEVITASYKALMRTAHPDKGGDVNTAKLLGEAYAVLSDPVKRRAYDAKLRQASMIPVSVPSTTFDPTALMNRLYAFGSQVLDKFERHVYDELELDPGAGTIYDTGARIRKPNRRRSRA
jgi:curved DNA-binding protein CbpA